MNRRAIGYLRVSTTDQHLGPEAQAAAIRRYCDAHGLALAETHTDHGVSGAAPLDARPGLMDAIGALQRGDVLIVQKRDRLARDTLAAAMIERMVTRAGATIIAADGAGNGDGPEALLLRRMLDAFAEFERATIAARTSAALRAKRARGERAGGIPWGFSADADGRLHPNPEEQEVTAAIQELHRSGLSQRKIVAALAERGIVGRTGRPLRQTQVCRILAA